MVEGIWVVTPFDMLIISFFYAEVMPMEESISNMTT